ncbi:MAG TPA: hypothetical protein VNY27_01960 [Solirubrobacteraceae bacterium]|nr:hypothetical protein [Solirubrobacteraceae bacterium]
MGRTTAFSVIARRQIRALYGTAVDGLQLLVGLSLLIALFALPAVLLRLLAPGVFDWILNNDSRGIVFLLLPVGILGGLTLAFRAFQRATRWLFSTSGTSFRRRLSWRTGRGRGPAAPIGYEPAGRLGGRRGEGGIPRIDTPGVQRGMAPRSIRRLKAVGGAVSNWFAEPKLEDATKRIELAEGERELFSCWLDERHRAKGVVLATDRRLIIAQGPGTDVLKDRGPASRVPGKIINGIDYTQIATVKGRYLDPFSSLVRILTFVLTFEDREGPLGPVPRVRIETSEAKSVEVAVDTPHVRRLLFLLASRTALDVPSSWIDRLPWTPLKR